MRRPLRGGVDRNLPAGSAPARRPLRGGVDRNSRIRRLGAMFMLRRRPLRGGVDRNCGCRPLRSWIETIPSFGKHGAFVAPYAGAWIETLTEPARDYLLVRIVAPYAGAWIETGISKPLVPCGLRSVAPYAGAWIETRPHPAACP